MDLLTGLGVASMVFVIAFTWRAACKATGEGQSPRTAIIEVWFNIVFGFSINYAAAMFVVPLATHGTLTAANNFWMGWVYTVISIIRQYIIRRWFNAQLVAAAKHLAGDT